MSLFSFLGEIVNEVVKDATGVDCGKTINSVKNSYSESNDTYKYFIENKDDLIEIYGDDEYKEMLKNIQNGFKYDLKSIVEDIKDHHK